MSLQKELSKLWGASMELSRLYEVIENELEGELNEYVEEQLQVDRENIEYSATNLLELRKLLQGQIDYANKDIERLSEIVSKRNKEVERIEKALQYALIKFGEKDKKGVYKMDLGIFQLSTRKSQVTEIDSEGGLEKLPAEYVKWEGKFKFDSETYKKAKEILIREMAINIEGNPVPDKTEIKKAILADAENDEGKSKDREILQSEKIQGAYVRNKLNLVIK